jgi:hypothetical protein
MLGDCRLVRKLRAAKATDDGIEDDDNVRNDGGVDVADLVA